MKKLGLLVALIAAIGNFAHADSAQQIVCTTGRITIKISAESFSHEYRVRSSYPEDLLLTGTAVWLDNQTVQLKSRFYTDLLISPPYEVSDNSGAVLRLSGDHKSASYVTVDGLFSDDVINAENFQCE